MLFEMDGAFDNMLWKSKSWTYDYWFDFVQMYVIDLVLIASQFNKNLPP